MKSMVLMSKTKEKVYRHMVNPSNTNCKGWKLLGRPHVKCKMLQVLHEVETWPTPAGDKLRDIWKEVKKKCPYFYELKPFVKERLTATDEAIRNSTELVF